MVRDSTKQITSPAKRVVIWGEEQGSAVKLSSLPGKRNEADFATNRLSCKGRKGNALALRADEGRDKLR